ncbi:MAG TPA: anti-sigma factor [Steroidobacteraceae bacterium]|jgi:anti-sigma-K factor RskA|nr:anti-sigma factor [Steroidobacteraceae bacterium]
MKSANRELVDRLAAEYVLGTLRGRARRRFERWLLSPQVGAIVKAWEDRLAGLEPRLESVAPPATVWRGIEDRLRLRKLGRGPAMRWVALAASLVIAAMVYLFFLSGGPVLRPLLATQQASIGDAQTIYWTVELLGDNEKIRATVRGRHALEAGKALELWVLPAQGNPVSLGLLPASGAQLRDLTAAQRTALAGARQLAVSLEPAGGSPTGLPTGPVLHVAPLAPA